VIADNLSTHKTQAVRTFLLEHPKHASALHADLFVAAQSNRTLVFEDQARPVARGIVTSVTDLARKIRRYIHRENKAPKPIRWAYRNPAHRISSTSASTVH
jgi:hypothetical protein